jgi:hypothetical protein
MNKRQAIINALNTAVPHLKTRKDSAVAQALLHIKSANRPDWSDAGVADEAMWTLIYMRRLPKSKARMKLIEDIQLALDMKD